VPRTPLREGRDGSLGGRRCARPCSLHRQLGAPILGSSCSPDFCRAFWGTGGATEKSARPWRMFARRADPRPFCARLLQLRAAQRSCAAGKAPQKSAGLRTTTWHSVAWAAGGERPEACERPGKNGPREERPEALDLSGAAEGNRTQKRGAGSFCSHVAQVQAATHSCGGALMGGLLRSGEEAQGRKGKLACEPAPARVTQKRHAVGRLLIQIRGRRLCLFCTYALMGGRFRPKKHTGEEAQGRKEHLAQT